MKPEFIQAVIAPGFLLMGLSHLVQPRLWARFFEAVWNTDLAAVIVPLVTLPIGLVLIAGHNVWVWDWPVILTIAGWGMTIKCAAYLLIPGLIDRQAVKKVATTPLNFQLVGAVMAIFGAVLTWQAWMHAAAAMPAS
jgi:hypothetical protein